MSESFDQELHLQRHVGPLVFWDGFGLKNPHSGIWVHANALGSELKKLSCNPVILVPQELAHSPANLNQHVIPDVYAVKKVVRKKIPIPSSSPAKKIFSETSSNQKIIYHGLCNFNLPVRIEKPNNARYVLTIHDIIPILAPSEFSLWQPLRAKFFLSKAAVLADNIICVSNWTRESFLTFFPEAENKTVVIPNGCDHLFSVPIKKMEMQPSETIRILGVSRFERYKRLDLMFEVIKRLPQNYRLSLITDARGERHAKRYAVDLLRSGRLKIFVSLTQEELTHKYQRSDIFLHPSRYEGFCIPAVEAILHRLPIVFQKGSGIDETIGEGCGIGLSADAKMDDWVEAVLLGKRIKEDPAYEIKAQKFQNQLPEWSAVAMRTKNIYDLRA